MLPLLLLATACGDEISAPAAPVAASGAPAFAGAPAPVRIPNSVRYSDLGAKPSTGRSGSAALRSFAVIGRDGITRLEIHSARASAPSVPAGTLAKVQVKRFGTDENLLGTTNHKIAASNASFTLAGLTRGSRVQVQANIRDIDRARTDVVTVVDTVRLRPDLAVSNLTVPAEVVAGIPTEITAVVRERNGDLGATTDCVLAVNGVEADRARGIWVDAGDAVSCAFTHVFTAGGDHAVSVAVVGSIPSDDDASNNVAAGTTHVTVEIPNAFAYQALVQDHIDVADWSLRELTQNVVTGEAQDWTVTSHDSVRVHTAVFSGTLPQSLAFPIQRLELTQRSNGVAVHSASLADRGYDVETADGARCARMTFGGGYSAVLCSDATLGTTSLVYRRDGTAVVYQGRYFATVWVRTAAGALDSYTVDVPQSGFSTSGPTLGALVSDFAFGVRLTQGDYRFIQDVAVPMTVSGPTQRVSPLTCGADVFSGDTFRRTCSASTALTSISNGFVLGASALP